MTSYGIIANCNFETRDDAEGIAIHKARKAVEGRTMTDATLVAALDNLEEVLERHADGADERSIRLCNEAERSVVAAYRSALAAEIAE